MENLEIIRTLAELDDKKNNEEFKVAFFASCFLIEMVADYYASSCEMTFDMFLAPLNICVSQLSEKEIYIANEMYATCKAFIARKQLRD